MEVDVHDIEAHVTRATGTQHGIEVGTIIVHQTTTVVNELCNLRDTGLEEAEGVGVGHHHGSDLRALLSDDTLQILEIHLTVRQ